MAKLTDFALATVGVLTIGAYGGLLLQGAPPEQALALALGGGLVLGILASLAFHLLGEDGSPLPQSLPGAGREAPDGGAVPGSGTIDRGDTDTGHRSPVLSSSPPVGERPGERWPRSRGEARPGVQPKAEHV